MNASILVAAISVTVSARLVMGVLAFLSGRVPVISIVIPIGLAVLTSTAITHLLDQLAGRWGIWVEDAVTPDCAWIRFSVCTSLCDC